MQDELGVDARRNEFPHRQVSRLHQQPAEIGSASRRGSAGGGQTSRNPEKHLAVASDLDAQRRNLLSQDTQVRQISLQYRRSMFSPKAEQGSEAVQSSRVSGRPSRLGASFLNGEGMSDHKLPVAQKPMRPPNKIYVNANDIRQYPSYQDLYKI